MKSPAKTTDKNGTVDFVARAERAMKRAGEKAMADYKRFGLQPVVAPSFQTKTKPHKD
jgi:hypothetical protein